MKKIMNAPEQYVDDMLRGIYRTHSDQVECVENDLRCYCIKQKNPGKVAIVTGGGTGHLPLFLGYVGENLLDGCAVGNVFQSPSAEQIFKVSQHVENGAGVLYLYGTYTGDVMNFDIAAELCDMEGIRTASIVGADDVYSSHDIHNRRGVAGIFFMYKCAGAKAAQMGTLEEVLAAAQKAKDTTRTVGFAMTPCIIPEVGHANFTLKDDEMAIGMGIHGEPGIWNGPMRTADQLAEEAVNTLLTDMPLFASDEVALLINGLGATSVEELYILADSVCKQLEKRKISIYRAFVGEFATSMEMAGASVSLMKLDAETKVWLDLPVNTPFYCQK